MVDEVDDPGSSGRGFTRTVHSDLHDALWERGSALSGVSWGVSLTVSWACCEDTLSSVKTA
jgi:hypothetical protein